MIIYVLPISGGGFPVQLAIIQHLCEQKIVPDVTMASSGGNVAAYISAAANWQWAKIEQIARELNNTLFAKPWSSVAIMSFVTGFFQGNLYSKGTGVEEFLKKHFSSAKIVEHEIWTGTYNKDTQKAQLFCNRARKNSIMARFPIDHNLTQSMENIYADGNVDLLAKVSLASASIPGLVPPQIIDGKRYTDGGNFGASPLTIMKGPLVQYISKSHKPVHLIYINSVDLSDIEKFDSFNVLDIWKQATEDLIRSFSVFDRLAAYEILRTQSNNIRHYNFICNYDNLKIVQEIYQGAKYTLLEVYPEKALEVNITNFTGDDTINLIHKIYKHCLCRFWWIEDLESNSKPEESAIAKLLSRMNDHKIDSEILYL